MVDSSPALLTMRSVPGWPLLSMPQRQSHSQKPSSQPRPPRLCRLMNFGCTTSTTGESQPSRTSPAWTERMPKPRVGMTVMVIAPLSRNTRSTPSCFPPWSVIIRTDQGTLLFGAALLLGKDR